MYPARPLSEQDLRSWLERESDPQIRKVLKDALYELAEHRLFNPDPLTVTDEPDLGRHTAGRRDATHLHHPHLHQPQDRSLRNRVQRGLDRLAVVRRKATGR